MNNMKKGKVEKEGFYCGCCGITWVLGPDDDLARMLYRFRVEQRGTPTRGGLAGTICVYCDEHRRKHGNTPCRHEQFFFGDNPNYRLMLEFEEEIHAMVKERGQEMERRREERKAKRSK